jgi:antitoxin (DNA-binding transcriptional repressor) of toxin-antitoxin stability system
MQYISTTQLRTKSSELIKTLKSGRTVEIIHRSKVVGEIRPKTYEARPLTDNDISDLKKIIDDLDLLKTTPKQREKQYRKHMESKYGKPVLRR